MKSAALRLESFNFAPGPSTFGPAHIDQAYHDGHERGLVEGREASLEKLGAQLAQISQALHLTEAEAARVRRETLASVGPILSAIVDLLGPAASRERLLTALVLELRRIAESCTAPEMKIKCAPDLSPDLRDCLNRAGLDAVLDDSDPAISGAELLINGGRITFDPTRAMTELKTLISEIHTGE